MLGLHVPDTDVTSGQLNLAGYRQVAERLTNEFGPPMVAITLRESLSASDNGWSAALWDAQARAPSITASTTPSAWSIGSAAATASPPA